MWSQVEETMNKKNIYKFTNLFSIINMKTGFNLLPKARKL